MSSRPSMGPATENQEIRRRLRRYSIAVPVDVVALRSGVPASIPGRTVNVSQGGLATVLAAEVAPGESVGVEFRLPTLRETIQAKAIVRHYSLMQCGLQFLSLPIEQENALKTWTQMADRSSVLSTSHTVTRSAPVSGPVQTVRPLKPKRNRGLRWVLMTVGIVFVVLAAVAWWSWNSGWRDLEDSSDAGSKAAAVIDVPSTVMAQRIVHSVNPIYPADAIKKKIQGDVTLDAVIGDDGTVKDISAANGPEALRAAAVDAVKWWRFEPYKENGRPVPVHTSIAVAFRLQR